MHLQQKNLLLLFQLVAQNLMVQELLLLHRHHHFLMVLVLVLIVKVRVFRLLQDFLEAD
jgi:hypothetical protein